MRLAVIVAAAVAVGTGNIMLGVVAGAAAWVATLDTDESVRTAVAVAAVVATALTLFEAGSPIDTAVNNTTAVVEQVQHGTQP